MDEYRRHTRSRDSQLDVTIEDVTYYEQYFDEYVKDIYSDDKYISIINKYKTLPLDERRLLIIYMLCGYKCTVVSQQLGISVAVVRNRIREIKSKLKK